ncbi:hypothetical protein CF116_19495 [Aeromonas veronii]|uniref:hypothetical protein n=1 Tax=Aeromonas veronii TaxID=654 RepID=UPI0011185E99|nr:hypothetical protein [Aeromonas veronii]TNI77718.1 hypothetical protein CF116_19495 [Aeromonas veronii]
MKFNNDREAIKRAVVMIESLIEATTRNQQDDMTKQLSDVKEQLLLDLDNSALNTNTIIKTIGLFKFISDLLSDS